MDEYGNRVVVGDVTGLVVLLAAITRNFWVSLTLHDISRYSTAITTVETYSEKVLAAALAGLSVCLISPDASDAGHGRQGTL